MFETNSLKLISMVNNCIKTLEKDAEKIEIKRQGTQQTNSDDEDDDKVHFEDAIEENNKKMSKGRFVLNYSKVQLKNKRERSIDNVRFEKQMSKTEKKIIEKARSKSTLLNRRTQSNLHHLTQS